MKTKLAKKFTSTLKKYDSYSIETISIIEYGFISLFNLITKLIIITLLSIIIGITKEMFIFMIIYIPLRSFSFGMHASKSSTCLIISVLIFLGFPLLSLLININVFIKGIVGLFLIILIIKNSPASTKKRPINKINRIIIYKILTSIICLLYYFIMIFTDNIFISNSLFFSFIIQSILTSKLMYKALKLKD